MLDLPLAAALLTVVLWSSAFVGIRAAGEDLGGGELSLLRLTVGSVALGATMLVRRTPLPARRDLPALVALGVIWFGVYNVVLNEGERRVDAGTAAMITNVGPVLIALLAGVVLREGFPRSLLGGCAIAFGGVVVIGVATSEHGVGASWGVALCLLAAIAYAVAVVVQKPLLGRSSGLAVTWAACTVGAIACLPFAGGLVDQLGRASAGHVAWAVYLGAVPTAIGFSTWAYALARTSAGRMGATTYLVPPLAVLLGWAILGEAPPALALAGGALCLLGVVVTRQGLRVLRRPSSPGARA
ncbi:MAG TPA: DMT family transporter [Solirubrobacteraceae bacterium]|jgi:drug/metabolite transporter (DMT)-like permease|nr:DMT family transporter [Solirubrobacteraceae bacterium]